MMFNKIINMLGLGSSTNFSELVKNGAVIVDVRSKREFENGHINGSINIPVDELSRNLKMLKDKNQTIIACCASGMRSASATSILKANGYINVYNGGGWSSLNNKL